jgi:methionyl-tRNA formyltransferase
LIDAGVDTGGILVQQELQFDPEIETFQTSYEKLHSTIQALFMERWDGLRSFSVSAKPQNLREGSRHYSQDLVQVKEIFGSQLWTTRIAEVKRRYRKARP